MNAAEHLQMYANFQRATMRRMLEAIVPLRSTQHLLWEKAGQQRLRNLLESIESLRDEGEWAEVRAGVGRILSERAGASGAAMLSTCGSLSREAETPMRQAYGLIAQVARGDLRQLAALRATLERHHVAALMAFDHEVGPFLALARQHLRDDEWARLMDIANGHAAPCGGVPHASQASTRAAAMWS